MEALPLDPAHQAELAEDPALGLERRTKFEILGAVLLALFLGALDQTIVGTALPVIVTDLGGNDLYTWVVTIYLLTSTITVPFYGKLSDLYGRKPLLMIGVTLFLVGSALSGLSQTMWQLILFRGLQGLGAGALFPISLAIIGDLFTPAERGRYQGLFGAMFGIAFLVGPALGGFLTDQVSWHMVFYVNLPIGIISLIVLARLLPNIKHPNVSRNLDILGATVFTVGISILLVGLTNKQFGAWTDFAVGGFIAISLALLAVFLVIEARAKEPIVPLDLWRDRTYASSMVATFFVSFGFFGAVIFLPRWFQFVLGSSATESGYQIFPLLIGLIGASIVSGILVSRTRTYKTLMVVSLSIMTVGLVLMAQLHADTPLPLLWGAMFIAGLGIGPTMAVFTIIVQNVVPFSKLGVATSNLTFFRQIGGSVGLAITGTIFETTLQQQLPVQLVAKGVPQQVVDQFANVSSSALGNLVGVGQNLGTAILAAVPQQFQALIQPLIPNIVAGIYEAFTLAVTSTFVLGVGASVIAVAATLVMREVELRTTLEPEPAPAAEHEERPAALPGPHGRPVEVPVRTTD